MEKKLTDKRLNALKSYLLDGLPYGVKTKEDIRTAIEELQTARQTIERLKKDGERLAKLLKSHTPFDEMPYEDDYEALDQHNALMKEIEVDNG